MGKNYLIIAHFHSKGLIRSDLKSLIDESLKRFDKVYLISTNLKKKETEKISKKIYFKIRKNEGYDFLSWKVGIQAFLKDYKKNIKDKHLFLLNSSYYFFDHKKFINKILAFKKKNNDKIWSLSKSYEMSYHLQSGFYCFPAKFFLNKKFYNWWNNIKKFKNRMIIVKKYELGFSNFLIKNNYKIDCIFKENLFLKPNSIVKKINQKFVDIFWKKTKLYKKNPTHYFWKNYLKKIGVIKIELIKKNPINTDLSYLKILDARKKNFLKEAMEN